MNASRRRGVTVLGLVAVSLFCVALVLVRFAKSGSTEYMGLIWNLFRAWIPFVLAVAVYDRWRRHGPAVMLVALGALWLLFFPNAPYIVTDFVPGLPMDKYVERHNPAALWAARAALSLAGVWRIESVGTLPARREAV